jgi:hypothetical protein
MCFQIKLQIKTMDSGLLLYITQLEHLAFNKYFYCSLPTATNLRTVKLQLDTTTMLQEDNLF